MKIKFFLLLTFLFTNFTQTERNWWNFTEKVVIGPRRVGFFSNFFGCLNMLAWCERNNKIPVMYWDEQCLYWEKNGYNGVATNAWEYYFEPVSDLKFNPGDLIYRTYSAPDGTGVEYKSLQCYDTLSYKTWGNTLIQKYIRIKKIVQNKIDSFYERHMKGKKVIGIHLRGTDKKNEVKVVDPQRVFQEANKYKGYHYLVATDEQRLLDLARQHLKGPVIYYPAERSNSTRPLHLAGGNGKRGEDVLVEVILLSKCDKFIHTCSNVSSAVLFFNPALENTLLLANKKSSMSNDKVCFC